MPPFLPFLYPAHTTRLPLRGPAVRYFQRTLHNSSVRCSDHSEPKPEQESEQLPWQPRRRLRAPKRTSIPFELPPDLAQDLAKDLEQLEADEAAKGTITLSERLTFKRIFKEIAHKNKAAASTQSRVNAIVGLAADDVAREWAKKGTLKTAIDEKLPPIPDGLDGSNTQQRAALAQFPASLRAAAGAAMGIKEAERARPRYPEDSNSITSDSGAVEEPSPASAAREALRVRQTKMELQMLAQKSDFGLWDYMEENVFTLVTEFGLRPDKRPRSASAGAAARRALATYAPLYAALLLHGVRLMDTRYGGSVLGRAVLPRVKALGLASYVLGAGTALYNAELVARWCRQGDWSAALQLLSEMQRAGISFDAGTLAIVRSMEWHLVPVMGGRDADAVQGTAASIGLGSGGEDLSQTFAAVAARQQPEMVGLPAQLAYWRQRVEHTINRGTRRM